MSGEVKVSSEAAKKTAEKSDAEQILQSARMRPLRAKAVPFQPKKQLPSSGAAVLTLLSHTPLKATAQEFKPKGQPLRISDKVKQEVDAFEVEVFERARHKIKAYEKNLQGKFTQELLKKAPGSETSIRAFAEVYSGVLRLEVEKFQKKENQRAANAIEEFQNKAFEDAEANTSSGLSPRRR